MIFHIRKKFEKRKYKRSESNYRGKFYTAKNVYLVNVKDLSLGGAGIEIVGSEQEKCAFENEIDTNEFSSGQLEIFDRKKGRAFSVLTKFSCRVTSSRNFSVGLSFEQ